MSTAEDTAKTDGINVTPRTMRDFYPAPEGWFVFTPGSGFVHPVVAWDRQLDSELYEPCLVDDDGYAQNAVGWLDGPVKLLGPRLQAADVPVAAPPMRPLSGPLDAFVAACGDVTDDELYWLASMRFGTVTPVPELWPALVAAYRSTMKAA